MSGAYESDEISVGKDAVQQRAYEAPDAMYREDVKAVINVQIVL